MGKTSEISAAQDTKAVTTVDSVISSVSREGGHLSCLQSEQKLQKFQCCENAQHTALTPKTAVVTAHTNTSWPQNMN